jgi:DNA-binding transcriptional regulator GbsR (MarR family)
MGARQDMHPATSRRLYGGGVLLNFQEILKIGNAAMNLPPLCEAFVLHFGEMGSRWGINRTVGQIYAVLFVAERPLCADDIVERLGISRSNVSMGLKELQSWNLLRARPVAGDRREFFATPDDIYAIVRTLVEERRKREIDPTLTMLRELLMRSPDSEAERHAQARMRDMHDLIELMTGWYEEVRKLETDRLIQLLSLGARVVRVLDMKDRLFALPGGRAAGGKEG